MAHDFRQKKKTTAAYLQHYIADQASFSQMFFGNRTDCTNQLRYCRSRQDQFFDFVLRMTSS